MPGGCSAWCTALYKVLIEMSVKMSDARLFTYASEMYELFARLQSRYAG